MDWACCWSSEEIPPERCPALGEADDERRRSLRGRFMSHCVACPRFAADVQRLQEEQNPLGGLVACLVDQVQQQQNLLGELATVMETRNREFRFLHELSTVLQGTLNLQEVLAVAMTAITAGKGFGMNRAFLLLSDRPRRRLRGFLAVGPRDAEEAARIWQEISEHDYTLREMAQNFYGSKLLAEKIKFSDILQRLDIPLADHQHILNRALLERKPLLVENAYQATDVDRELVELLGADSFLVMPLVSKQRRIGVIIADNCITRRPISQADIESLETFSFPVAFAIERAYLHERLQEELDKVREASARLETQQDLIVRMEKMAVVGRITANLAHSVRNPLAVIGGFARTLLKSASTDDPRRDYLESMVREASQLEEVLQEVLDAADGSQGAMDFWDLNQLARRACGEQCQRFSGQGVRCVYDLAAELPPVYIDYKQLANCVRNATSKILEVLPGGGEVRVTTRLTERGALLELGSSGGRARASQRGGLGEFFSPDESGQGLGISLCRTLLERHGAEFDLEYQADGEVRCSILLPIRTEVSHESHPGSG